MAKIIELPGCSQGLALQPQLRTRLNTEEEMKLTSKGKQETAKTKQLDSLLTGNNQGEHLTTDQGVQIADNQNSLKAGVRGPTLMEDFIFREKMTHFDHERIPERVVHARGSAAHS